MARNIHSGLDQLCPFCRSPVSSEAIVRCRSCGTVHHRICWQHHHHCSVFGCDGSYPRTKPIPIGFAAGAVLVPIFVLLLFATLSFSVAALEFGIPAGYQSLRNGLELPVLLLTVLLLCGLYTFYIDDIRD
jgi:Prokaryotic RING finger family 1